MSENLSEMVAEGEAAAPVVNEETVAKIAAEANQLIAEEIQKQIIDFAKGLSEDVKTVAHGKTVSIKLKNRNFVYLTRSKKSTPLKVQVKNGKDWTVVALDVNAGFEGLKKVIQDSFNALQ